MRLHKEECPFCHAREAVVKRWGKMNLMFVACKACKACGPAKVYTQDAVNAWNSAKRRVDAIHRQEGFVDKYYCGGCGRSLILGSMTPGVNYKFCPGCGGEISQPTLF